MYKGCLKLIKINNIAIKQGMPTRWTLEWPNSLWAINKDCYKDIQSGPLLFGHRQ